MSAGNIFKMKYLSVQHVFFRINTRHLGDLYVHRYDFKNFESFEVMYSLLSVIGNVPLHWASLNLRRHQSTLKLRISSDLSCWIVVYTLHTLGLYSKFISLAPPLISIGILLICGWGAFIYEFSCYVFGITRGRVCCFVMRNVELFVL